MNYLLIPRYAFKLMAVVMICTPFFSIASPLPWGKHLVEIFVSYEFKVAINFPGSYEEKISQKTDDEGKVTRTLAVTSKYSGSTYYLIATKHPITLTDIKGLAQTSLNGFVNELNGELISQKTYIQKGNEGKDALIYLSAQNKFIHYRVILIGQFQYQLVIIDDSSSLSDEVSKFMNSFKMQ